MISAAVFAAVAIIAGTSILVYAVSRNTRDLSGTPVDVATSGVTIIENADPGFGRKEISFKNNKSTNSPVLLRIAYSETWTNSNNEIVSNMVGNTNVVTKNWTTAFAQDFVDGQDGWYYYKKTLEPLAQVQVLSSIALNDNSYNVYNYDIAFRFEAVQADATAASELWGKTVTIANGVATWTLP